MQYGISDLQIIGNKKAFQEVYEPSAFQGSILARPLYGLYGRGVSALFGSGQRPVQEPRPGQNDRHTWLKIFSIPVASLSSGNKFK